MQDLFRHPVSLDAASPGTHASSLPMAVVIERMFALSAPSARKTLASAKSAYASTQRD